jgi:hypothetical protein
MASSLRKLSHAQALTLPVGDQHDQASARFHFATAPRQNGGRYKESDRLAGRKAQITGGDSGMGRAAAIAYAREGCDAAINCFPTEEPDAQEVIAQFELHPVPKIPS